MTNVEVLEDVRMMLSFVLKFAVNYETDEVPMQRLITDCEYICMGVQEEEKRNTLRAEVTNVINNITKTRQLSNVGNMFKRYADETTYFLKQRNWLSDKGKKSIVMYKEQFNEKAE